MIKIENTLWNEDELKAVVKRLYMTAKKYPKGSKQYTRYMELSNYYAEQLKRA